MSDGVLCSFGHFISKLVKIAKCPLDLDPNTSKSIQIPYGLFHFSVIFQNECHVIFASAL